MGNRNPNPATRFGNRPQPEPGKIGRQKGTRDRLTKNFIYELAETFEKQGKAAITTLIAVDPGRYLTIIASLVPKEIEISRPLGDMSDDALLAAIDALTTAIRAQAPMPPPDEDADQYVMQ